MVVKTKTRQRGVRRKAVRKPPVGKGKAGQKPKAKSLMEFADTKAIEEAIFRSHREKGAFARLIVGRSDEGILLLGRIVDAAFLAVAVQVEAKLGRLGGKSSDAWNDFPKRITEFAKEIRLANGFLFSAPISSRGIFDRGVNDEPDLSLPSIAVSRDIIHDCGDPRHAKGSALPTRSDYRLGFPEQAGTNMSLRSISYLDIPDVLCKYADFLRSEHSRRRRRVKSLISAAADAAEEQLLEDVKALRGHYNYEDVSIVLEITAQHFAKPTGAGIPRGYAAAELKQRHYRRRGQRRPYDLSPGSVVLNPVVRRGIGISDETFDRLVGQVTNTRRK